jgi:hypothetical protein
MSRMSMCATELAMLIGACCTLHAQGVQDRPVNVGVMGGLTVPTHYLADSYGGYDTHVDGNVGAFFAVPLPNTPLSFRVDGQWQDLTSRGGSLGSDYRIVDGTANLVYNFASAPRTSFYVIAGAGVYRERVHADFTDFTATATHYGYNGGVGVNVRFSRFATFLEARYHYVVRGSQIGSPDCNVPEDLLPHTCAADTRPSMQFIPISMGFAF